MKIISKWIVMSLCLVLLASCSKKPVELVDQVVEVTEKEDADHGSGAEEKNSDEINNNSENMPHEELEEEIADDVKVIDTEALIKELVSDSWVDEESLYIARDKSFVVYKKWLVDIGSMEFDVYIWDFKAEPKMIKNASGFVQGIEVSPDDKLMIIHMGTTPITTGLVYSIEKNTIMTRLESVDVSIWSEDSSNIIARKITMTEDAAMDGYFESLMYWDVSTVEPIEVMSTSYGITFDSIRSTKSDVQVYIVYPSGSKTEVSISYDQLKNNDYPNLYDSDPYHYIKAKIDWLESINQGTTYMNDDFALFWDTDNQTLSMWYIEEGITIVEEGMGAYTDMLASLDSKYVAMTLGTSSVRELIVFDSSHKSIVHRIEQVYDSLYWSPNSQFLAFNILNEKVINPNIENDRSMDVGVLYMNDLIAKRVAKGSDSFYLLVEGFSDIGLNVYQADLMFQKTRGYSISNDTLLDINEDFEIINKEEATFTFLEIKFDNDYTTQRINDGIFKLDNFYVRDGYNTLVPEGYLPVASTVDQFNTSDNYLSLFFTFTYRNEDGNEIKRYDSLTYHTKDGVLIDFVTMFKAEEIENVFSQMLIDEVQAKELVLLKAYEGFKEDAKFYFTEDGIIVYYGEGVYTDISEGPLNIKLTWGDLRGVIDRDTLVY